MPLRLFFIKQIKIDSITISFCKSSIFIYQIYNFSGRLLVLLISTLIGFYKPNKTKFSTFLSNVAENNKVYLLLFFVYSSI